MYRMFSRRMRTIVVCAVMLMLVLASRTALAGQPDSMQSRKMLRSSLPLTRRLIPSHVNKVILSVKPAVVLVESINPDGMDWGTGFVISSDGYIVTNHHVVDRTQGVNVYLMNKEKLPATVVKTDRDNDLALLKVNAPGPLYTVRLSNQLPYVGARIITTGYPQPPTMTWLGLSLDSSSTSGIVSGRRETNGGLLPQPSVIQMDCSISPGNSGSPVYFANGDGVIGIAVASLKGTGINFAIPVAKLKQLLVDAGVHAKPLPANPAAAAARVVPGDLKMLNVIPPSRELNPLFGRSFVVRPDYSRLTTNRYFEAVQGYRGAYGVNPPLVTAPIAIGHKIYFGGIDNVLYEYDTRTQVRRPLLQSEQSFFFPAVANRREICATSGELSFSGRVNGLMYAFLGVTSIIGHVEGRGTLMGLNRENGNIDWQVKTGFLARPLMKGDHVIAGGLGTLSSHNVFSGTQDWSIGKHVGGDSTIWYYPGYSDGKLLYGLDVPVTVNKNLTMIGHKKASLVCRSATDGTTKWSVVLEELHDRPHPLSAGLKVLPKSNEIIVVLSDRIWACKLSDGSTIWSYTTRRNVEKSAPKDLGRYFNPQVAEHDGVLYVGCDDHHLYAFSASTGKKLWPSGFPTRGVVGAPTVSNGVVYVGSSDHRLYAVDAKSGALQWTIRSNAGIRGRPVVLHHVVYFSNDTGEFWAVRMPL